MEAGPRRRRGGDNRRVTVAAELTRGRTAYNGREWAAALEALSAADRSAPLGAEDVERLATCAYMLGREREFRDLLARAYSAHLECGEGREALRCAFWIGVTLARQGEMGQAGGWLSRAKKLLDRVDEECVEHGYLMLPRVFELEARGDAEAAARLAGEAAALGERLGDSDLFALAAHEQGHILIQDGRLTEGLGLLDESMVAVTTGELSPIVSGIVYCGVILACQDAHEVRRAQEWTAALSRWCEQQPDLVAFGGRCLVHRAEIMQLRGDWPEALEEARRAAERALEGANPRAAGEAHYRAAELHRLRGDLAAAEEAYREATAHGREPQPGLALLRLAQGSPKAAAAALRRIDQEVSEPGRRIALLPAFVEVMLEAGDPRAAQSACRELERIAEGQEGGALEAMAGYARGAVALAAGDARSAHAAASRAERTWKELAAPYEAARARALMGLACRALGDEDSARLDLDVARAALAELGAAVELARLDSLTGGHARDGHGLSPREIEVLRHLAAGATNKAIAAELVLSVRTVDRHVSNIFIKLGVSSRAAATAYAHEHGLV